MRLFFFSCFRENLIFITSANFSVSYPGNDMHVHLGFFFFFSFKSQLNQGKQRYLQEVSVCLQLYQQIF